MRVLIAPDKFKGSLTAAEVADHLAKGLAEAGAHSRTLPLADGGDGSVAAALASGFHPLPVDVHGATGQNHRSVVAFDDDTAIVEVANTCGLATLPGGVLRPDDRVELRLRRSHPGGADPGPHSGWCSRWAAAPAPTAESACSPRSVTASSTGPAICSPPPPRTWAASTASTRSRAVNLDGHRAHRRRRRHQPAARTDRRRRRVRPPKGRHRSPSRTTRRRTARTSSPPSPAPGIGAAETLRPCPRLGRRRRHRLRRHAAGRHHRLRRGVLPGPA